MRSAAIIFEKSDSEYTIIIHQNKMGNTTTRNSLVLESYPLALQHPKFNNSIFKRKMGEQVIVSELSLGSEEQYDYWEKRLLSNPGTDLQGVLNPLKHSYKKTGMCGSSGTAKIQYDNYPFILKQTIKDKQNAEHRKFKQSQLWYLIYIISAVGLKFHTKRQKIGDIRPQNIFINEDGQIKIATKYSFPNEISNYQKAFYNHEKTYLAPQEIKNLQIGYTQSICKIGPAEIFSSGLTVLDASLLQNSEKLYEKPKKFDFDLLEGKQQNLKYENGYGQLLKVVVLNMTQLYPQDRISFQELYEWLEPFSEKILNLDAFQTQNLPEKLKKTYQKNPIQKIQIDEKTNGFLKNTKHYPFIKKAQSKEISNYLTQFEEKQQIHKLHSSPPPPIPPRIPVWGVDSQEIVLNQTDLEKTKSRKLLSILDSKELKTYKSEENLLKKNLYSRKEQIRNFSPMKKTRPFVNISYVNTKGNLNDMSFAFKPQNESRKELGQAFTQTLGQQTPFQFKSKKIERKREINPEARQNLLTQTRRIKERSNSTLKRIQDTIQLSKKMFPSPNYAYQ